MTTASARLLILSLLLAAATGIGCRRKEPAPSPPTVEAPSPGSAGWYRQRTARVLDVLDKGQGWLDGLRLDPYALREVGLNGKRQLVALIEAWRWLYETAEGARKEALLARIVLAAAPTREPRFHDLAEVSDLRFKQVATSYLRCAWLLDLLGQDVSEYKRQILAVKARYDRHMGGRGYHQKVAMRGYYRHFGMAFPEETLAGPPKGSLIASRRSAASMAPLEAYQLTHEVLAPYDFGDRPDAKPFSPADLTYLETTLHLLMLKYIEVKDPDLLSELLLCALLIDRRELPSVPQAIEVILAAQNPNGSFGHYARAEAKLGRLVDYEVYVHTSLVVFHALVAAWRAAGVALPLR